MSLFPNWVYIDQALTEFSLPKVEISQFDSMLMESSDFPVSVQLELSFLQVHDKARKTFDLKLLVMETASKNGKPYWLVFFSWKQTEFLDEMRGLAIEIELPPSLPILHNHLVLFLVSFTSLILSWMAFRKFPYFSEFESWILSLNLSLWL